MSTGSLSDAEDFPEVDLMLECEGGCGGGGVKMAGGSRPLRGGGASGESRQPASERGLVERGVPGSRAGGPRKKAPSKKSCPLGASAASGSGAPEAGGKQVQRHAANARERARMRVLSKAFSRLKTTLPWVPPDTKLSKLDTLRLASSYIAHLRQILASDKLDNGYIHPVNLTWPFMVAGKPENELKEAVNTARLCGPTAS